MMADHCQHMSKWTIPRFKRLRICSDCSRTTYWLHTDLSGFSFRGDGFTPSNELLTALRLRRCAEQYTAVRPVYRGHARSLTACLQYRQLQQGPSHSVNRNYQATRQDGISLNQGQFPAHKPSCHPLSSMVVQCIQGM